MRSGCPLVMASNSGRPARLSQDIQQGLFAEVAIGPPGLAAAGVEVAVRVDGDLRSAEAQVEKVQPAGPGVAKLSRKQAVESPFDQARPLGQSFPIQASGVAPKKP